MSRRVVGLAMAISMIGDGAGRSCRPEAASVAAAAPCGLVITHDTVLTQDYTCDSAFPLSDSRRAGRSSPSTSPGTR